MGDVCRFAVFIMMFSYVLSLPAPQTHAALGAHAHAGATLLHVASVCLLKCRIEYTALTYSVNMPLLFLA